MPRTKPKNKLVKLTRVQMRQLEEKFREKWLEERKAAAEYDYNRGYKAGKQEAEKEFKQSMEAESLKVRLELGRAFAAVFEGITRSASMFFDGGANCLRL